LTSQQLTGDERTQPDEPRRAPATRDPVQRAEREQAARRPPRASGRRAGGPPAPLASRPLRELVTRERLNEAGDSLVGVIDIIELHQQGVIRSFVSNRLQKTVAFGVEIAEGDERAMRRADAGRPRRSITVLIIERVEPVLDRRQSPERVESA